MRKNKKLDTIAEMLGEIIASENIKHYPTDLISIAQSYIRDPIFCSVDKFNTDYFENAIIAAACKRGWPNDD